METINIFLNADLTQYLLFVDMLRQWKLHKDAWNKSTYSKLIGFVWFETGI
jgi:hypothetical protein